MEQVQEREIIENISNTKQNTKDIADLKEITSKLISSTQELCNTVQLVAKQNEQIIKEQAESKKDNTISITGVIKQAIVGFLSGGVSAAIIYGIIQNMK